MKIDNFKIYFKNVLREKYKLNQEDINEYFNNKEQQERIELRKNLGIGIGFSELLLSSLLCIINQDNSSYMIPILTLGGVGAITVKVSSLIKNPYYLDKYKKIDKEYIEQKAAYKRLNKRK